MAESVYEKDSMGTQKDTVENATGRLLSVDALRGFDMFWIIGGSTLINECAKFCGTPVADVIHTQFKHVKWEGFHFFDMIFPLFMLLMGVVLPYTIARRRERGESRGRIAFHFIKRSLGLIVLGLLYQGILRFEWSQMRWSAVLTLIGGSYLIAALIALFFSVRFQAVWTVVLLLGYWAVLAWGSAEMEQNGVIVSYGNGNYSVEHSLISYLDQRLIPGVHPYGGATNGVGPFLSFTGAASVLLGVLVGHWLRSNRTGMQKWIGLIAAGVVCLVIGWFWGLRFPIIKLLWTSSYVLFAGGWSLLLLALFYGLIDLMGYRRWAFFFVVIGMNPITIYFGQKFIDFGKMGTFFWGGIANHAGMYQALVLTAGIVLIKWLFLYWLYRRKIFLRL